VFLFLDDELHSSNRALCCCPGDGSNMDDSKTELLVAEVALERFSDPSLFAIPSNICSLPHSVFALPIELQSGPGASPAGSILMHELYARATNDVRAWQLTGQQSLRSPCGNYLVLQQHTVEADPAERGPEHSEIDLSCDSDYGLGCSVRLLALNASKLEDHALSGSTVVELPAFSLQACELRCHQAANQPNQLPTPQLAACVSGLHWPWSTPKAADAAILRTIVREPAPTRSHRAPEGDGASEATKRSSVHQASALASRIHPCAEPLRLAARRMTAFSPCGRFLIILTQELPLSVTEAEVAYVVSQLPSAEDRTVDVSAAAAAAISSQIVARPTDWSLQVQDLAAGGRCVMLLSTALLPNLVSAPAGGLLSSDCDVGTPPQQLLALLASWASVVPHTSVTCMAALPVAVTQRPVLLDGAGASVLVARLPLLLAGADGALSLIHLSFPVSFHQTWPAGAVASPTPRGATVGLCSGLSAISATETGSAPPLAESAVVSRVPCRVPWRYGGCAAAGRPAPHSGVAGAWGSSPVDAQYLPPGSAGISDLLLRVPVSALHSVHGAGSVLLAGHLARVDAMAVQPDACNPLEAGPDHVVAVGGLLWGGRGGSCDASDTHASAVGTRSALRLRKAPQAPCRQSSGATDPAPAPAQDAAASEAAATSAPASADRASTPGVLILSLSFGSEAVAARPASLSAPATDASFSLVARVVGSGLTELTGSSGERGEAAREPDAASATAQHERLPLPSASPLPPHPAVWAAVCHACTQPHGDSGANFEAAALCAPLMPMIAAFRSRHPSTHDGLGLPEFAASAAESACRVVLNCGYSWRPESRDGSSHAAAAYATAAAAAESEVYGSARTRLPEQPRSSGLVSATSSLATDSFLQRFARTSIVAGVVELLVSPWHNLGIQDHLSPQLVAATLHAFVGGSGGHDERIGRLPRLPPFLAPLSPALDFPAPKPTTGESLGIVTSFLQLADSVARVACDLCGAIRSSCCRSRGGGSEGPAAAVLPRSERGSDANVALLHAVLDVSPGLSCRLADEDLEGLVSPSVLHSLMHLPQLSRATDTETRPKALEAAAVVQAVLECVFSAFRYACLSKVLLSAGLLQRQLRVCSDASVGVHGCFMGYASGMGRPHRGAGSDAMETSFSTSGSGDDTEAVVLQLVWSHPGAAGSASSPPVLACLLHGAPRHADECDRHASKTSLCVWSAKVERSAALTPLPLPPRARFAASHCLWLDSHTLAVASDSGHACCLQVTDRRVVSEAVGARQTVDPCSTALQVVWSCNPDCLGAAASALKCWQRATALEASSTTCVDGVSQAKLAVRVLLPLACPRTAHADVAGGAPAPQLFVVAGQRPVVRSGLHRRVPRRAGRSQGPGHSQLQPPPGRQALPSRTDSPPQLSDALLYGQPLLEQAVSSVTAVVWCPLLSDRVPQAHSLSLGSDSLLATGRRDELPFADLLDAELSIAGEPPAHPEVSDALPARKASAAPADGIWPAAVACHIHAAHRAVRALCDVLLPAASRLATSGVTRHPRDGFADTGLPAERRVLLRIRAELDCQAFLARRLSCGSPLGSEPPLQLGGLGGSTASSRQWVPLQPALLEFAAPHRQGLGRGAAAQELAAWETFLHASLPSLAAAHWHVLLLARAWCDGITERAALRARAHTEDVALSLPVASVSVSFVSQTLVRMLSASGCSATAPGRLDSTDKLGVEMRTAVCCFVAWALLRGATCATRIMDALFEVWSAFIDPALVGKAVCALPPATPIDSAAAFALISAGLLATRSGAAVSHVAAEEQTGVGLGAVAAFEHLQAAQELFRHYTFRLNLMREMLLLEAQFQTVHLPAVEGTASSPLELERRSRAASSSEPLPRRPGELAVPASGVMESDPWEPDPETSHASEHSVSARSGGFLDEAGNGRSCSRTLESGSGFPRAATHHESGGVGQAPFINQELLSWPVAAAAAFSAEEWEWLASADAFDVVLAYTVPSYLLQLQSSATHARPSAAPAHVTRRTTNRGPSERGAMVCLLLRALPAAATPLGLRLLDSVARPSADIDASLPQTQQPASCAALMVARALAANHGAAQPCTGHRVAATHGDNVAEIGATPVVIFDGALPYMHELLAAHGCDFPQVAAEGIVACVPDARAVPDVMDGRISAELLALAAALARADAHMPAMPNRCILLSAACAGRLCTCPLLLVGWFANRAVRLLDALPATATTVQLDVALEQANEELRGARALLSSHSERGDTQHDRTRSDAPGWLCRSTVSATQLLRLLGRKLCSFAASMRFHIEASIAAASAERGRSADGAVGAFTRWLLAGEEEALQRQLSTMLSALLKPNSRSAVLPLAADEDRWDAWWWQVASVIGSYAGSDISQEAAVPHSLDFSSTAVPGGYEHGREGEVGSWPPPAHAALQWLIDQLLTMLPWSYSPDLQPPEVASCSTVEAAAQHTLSARSHSLRALHCLCRLPHALRGPAASPTHIVGATGQRAAHDGARPAVTLAAPSLLATTLWRAALACPLLCSDEAAATLLSQACSASSTFCSTVSVTDEESLCRNDLVAAVHGLPGKEAEVLLPAVASASYPLLLTWLTSALGAATTVARCSPHPEHLLSAFCARGRSVESRACAAADAARATADFLPMHVPFSVFLAASVSDGPASSSTTVHALDGVGCALLRSVSLRRHLEHAEHTRHDSPAGSLSASHRNSSPIERPCRSGPAALSSPDGPPGSAEMPEPHAQSVPHTNDRGAVGHSGSVDATGLSPTFPAFGVVSVASALGRAATQAHSRAVQAAHALGEMASATAKEAAAGGERLTAAAGAVGPGWRARRGSGDSKKFRRSVAVDDSDSAGDGFESPDLEGCAFPSALARGGSAMLVQVCEVDVLEAASALVRLPAFAKHAMITLFAPRGVVGTLLDEVLCLPPNPARLLLGQAATLCLASLPLGDPFGLPVLAVADETPFSWRWVGGLDGLAEATRQVVQLEVDVLSSPRPSLACVVASCVLRPVAEGFVDTTPLLRATRRQPNGPAHWRASQHVVAMMRGGLDGVAAIADLLESLLPSGHTEVMDDVGSASCLRLTRSRVSLCRVLLELLSPPGFFPGSWVRKTSACVARARAAAPLALGYALPSDCTVFGSLAGRASRGVLSLVDLLGPLRACAGGLLPVLAWCEWLLLRVLPPRSCAACLRQYACCFGLVEPDSETAAGVSTSWPGRVPLFARPAGLARVSAAALVSELLTQHTADPSFCKQSTHASPLTLTPTSAVPSSAQPCSAATDDVAEIRLPEAAAVSPAPIAPRGDRVIGPVRMFQAAFSALAHAADTLAATNTPHEQQRGRTRVPRAANDVFTSSALFSRAGGANPDVEGSQAMSSREAQQPWPSQSRPSQSPTPPLAPAASWPPALDSPTGLVGAVVTTTLTALVSAALQVASVDIATPAPGWAVSACAQELFAEAAVLAVPPVGVPSLQHICLASAAIDGGAGLVPSPLCHANTGGDDSSVPFVSDAPLRAGLQVLTLHNVGLLRALSGPSLPASAARYLFRSKASVGFGSRARHTAAVHASLRCPPCDSPPTDASLALTTPSIGLLHRLTLHCNGAGQAGEHADAFLKALCDEATQPAVQMQVADRLRQADAVEAADDLHPWPLAVSAACERIQVDLSALWGGSPGACLALLRDTHAHLLQMLQADTSSCPGDSARLLEHPQPTPECVVTALWLLMYAGLRGCDGGAVGSSRGLHYPCAVVAHLGPVGASANELTRQSSALRRSFEMGVQRLHYSARCSAVVAMSSALPPGSDAGSHRTASLPPVSVSSTTAFRASFMTPQAADLAFAEAARSWGEAAAIECMESATAPPASPITACVSDHDRAEAHAEAGVASLSHAPPSASPQALLALSERIDGLVELVRGGDDEPPAAPNIVGLRPLPSADRIRLACAWGVVAAAIAAVAPPPGATIGVLLQLTAGILDASATSQRDGSGRSFATAWFCMLATLARGLTPTSIASGGCGVTGARGVVLAAFLGHASALLRTAELGAGAQVMASPSTDAADKALALEAAAVAMSEATAASLQSLCEQSVLLHRTLTPEVAAPAPASIAHRETSTVDTLLHALSLPLGSRWLYSSLWPQLYPLFAPAAAGLGIAGVGDVLCASLPTPELEGSRAFSAPPVGPSAAVLSEFFAASRDTAAPVGNVQSAPAALLLALADCLITAAVGASQPLPLLLAKLLREFLPPLQASRTQLSSAWRSVNPAALAAASSDIKAGAVLEVVLAAALDTAYAAEPRDPSDVEGSPLLRGMLAQLPKLPLPALCRAYLIASPMLRWTREPRAATDSYPFRSAFMSNALLPAVARAASSRAVSTAASSAPVAALAHASSEATAGALCALVELDRCCVTASLAAIPELRQRLSPAMLDALALARRSVSGDTRALGEAASADVLRAALALAPHGMAALAAALGRAVCAIVEPLTPQIAASSLLSAATSGVDRGEGINRGDPFARMAAAFELASAGTACLQIGDEHAPAPPRLIARHAPVLGLD